MTFLNGRRRKLYETWDLEQTDRLVLSIIFFLTEVVCSTVVLQYTKAKPGDREGDVNYLLLYTYAYVLQLQYPSSDATDRDPVDC